MMTTQAILVPLPDMSKWNHQEATKNANRILKEAIDIILEATGGELVDLTKELKTKKHKTYIVPDYLSEITGMRRQIEAMNRVRRLSGLIATAKGRNNKIILIVCGDPQIEASLQGKVDTIYNNPDDFTNVLNLGR